MATRGQGGNIETPPIVRKRLVFVNRLVDHGEPGGRRDIYLHILGENEEGYVRVAIKLLLATNKTGEFETLNKGAVLSLAQFGRFCDQLENIGAAVNDMCGYLLPASK